MIYELNNGKFLEKNGNTASGVLGIFSFDERENVTKFLGEKPASLDKINKYTTFFTTDKESVFVINRAEEVEGKMKITKLRIITVADKTACVTDDVDKISDLVSSLEDVTEEVVVPMLIQELVKPDVLYLEEQEKELAELEALFLREKGIHSSQNIIEFRRKFMVLKRSYEQLLQGLNEAQKYASEGAVSVYTELVENVSGLSEDLLNLRDFVSQVREAYQEQVDISLNSVMKFLTVVTSIFMPLSFLAGWYGMNLKMPEVDLEYGYAIPIVITIVVATTCIVYFAKKKWFY